VSNYTGSTPNTQHATNWRDAAACREVDPDLFFPTPGDTRGTNAAKSICLTCPVRRTCLINALAEEGGKAKDNRFGIRGGKTHGQRYAMYAAARKQRQAAA
jgi:WhiB family redox-sensing transcriptional regulator